MLAMMNEYIILNVCGLGEMTVVVLVVLNEME